MSLSKLTTDWGRPALLAVICLLAGWCASDGRRRSALAEAREATKRELELVAQTRDSFAKLDVQIAQASRRALQAEMAIAGQDRELSRLRALRDSVRLDPPPPLSDSTLQAFGFQRASEGGFRADSATVANLVRDQAELVVLRELVPQLEARALTGDQLAASLREQVEALTARALLAETRLDSLAAASAALVKASACRFPCLPPPLAAVAGAGGALLVMLLLP